MIRFAFLESAGMRAAVMTDRSDGDCSDRPENTANVDALLERLPARPRRLLRMRQVHGACIVDADAINTAEQAPHEADGLITRQPDTALGVSVADCAPVVLYDPVRRAAAALHAGREGTRLNIAHAGVRALAARFGCRAEHLLAVIGPCAGPCCYEVAPPMAQAWRDAGLPARGRCLDIADANRIQLENAGVFRHNIRVVSHCTVCSGVFFSHRADNTWNRNLVLVMV